jgi:hypothetical protein
MLKCAVIVLVGPNQKELTGLADLLDSLWTYEPQVSWVVLIDDNQYDRKLSESFGAPASCKLISLVNPRQGKGDGYTGGMCTGVLASLAWIQSHTATNFVLKLDTDALIIAPFAEKIHRTFALMPNVGMVGSYNISCNGWQRKCSYWANVIQELYSPAGIWWSRTMTAESLCKIREHIQTALNKGYDFGEHCLGGAYAVSAEMIHRMATYGYLDDPQLWVHTRNCEDIMLGVCVRAVGLEMRSLVAQDEPFGLSHIGLADTPERLLAREYSLIHSVKNDKRFSEAEIRQFYQEIRKRDSGRQQKSDQRISGIVQAILPPDTKVIVVSKGADELLSLGGCQGWHFPQTEEGWYAGYHPADSAEAIAHLEKLRAKGGSYLLFPHTAFWWLDFYTEFRQYLDNHYQRTWHDERAVLYDLHSMEKK